MKLVHYLKFILRIFNFNCLTLIFIEKIEFLSFSNNSSPISEYLLKCQFSHQLNFYGYLEMLLEVLTYMLFEIENLVDFQSKVFG